MRLLHQSTVKLQCSIHFWPLAGSYGGLFFVSSGDHCKRIAEPMFQRESLRCHLKIIHYVSIAGIIVALGLLAAGFSEVAGLIIGLVTAVEILFSIFTGKQTNDGPR